MINYTNMSSSSRIKSAGLRLQSNIIKSKPDKVTIKTSTSPRRQERVLSSCLEERDKLKRFLDEQNKLLFDQNPKPAIFIVRKIFSDFVQLTNRKIESILDDENLTNSKNIFYQLEKSQDLLYAHILQAFNCISEFCLPSLLRLLIDWYHHQLDIVEHIQREQQQQSSNATTELQPTNTAPNAGPVITGRTPIPSSSRSFSDNCDSPQRCPSPSHDTIVSQTSITIRSPTPSSPDITSNQISITSTLPLEYQSPSLTLISSNIIDNDKLLNSSAANTSTSTATNVSSSSLTTPDDSTNQQNAFHRLTLVKTRKLLIEYTFCQALIEVFEQLHLHPGHENLIDQVIDLAFEHFRYVEEDSKFNINSIDSTNINSLSDKFAKLIGVIAKTRYKIVSKRFMTELSSLNGREQTPFNVQSIVTLLSGIKYIRVKMAPIEDFEASFKFLQELADYFLEVRNKSIRHALSNLFVEILTPLAIIVKNEVKIPCLKNFVDSLWTQTLDMCARKKHSLTLFPLVTCLLCVSQKLFFLANWGVFLNLCISNLKNRDQKMRRQALESIYRLVYVYVIRVKCESNNVTQARFNSIVEAMFPRGSRSIAPRDAPMDIFVDIIYIIAQERLDFAMKHIICDLLSVERPFKVILAPERMSIAIQAFLFIVDSLQQKEVELRMPRFISDDDCLCSRRKSYSNKMLNFNIAKSIGIYPYYSHIQKSFNDILKALDAQYGRPLMKTLNQNMNKDSSELITSERKLKIELFETCLDAIPRLMPEGMGKSDLVDLLARMTIHIDEGIREKSIKALRILISDFPDWRLDVIGGYTIFFETQVVNNTILKDYSVLYNLDDLLEKWREALALSYNPDCRDLINNKSNRNVNNGDGEDEYETNSMMSFESILACENMKNYGELCEQTFPNHVIILLTHILANYIEPSKTCLEMARRLVLWIEEHKFDEIINLQTVLSLYSRRSFSKDALQLTKCIIKYLHDAYPNSLSEVFPMLIELLENGPERIQKIICPILYCILNNLDLNEFPQANSQPLIGSEPKIDDKFESNGNDEDESIKLSNNNSSNNNINIMNLYLSRIYTRYFGDDEQWKDVLQMFKLIISKSSTLVVESSAVNSDYGRELSGRTMDFSIDIGLIPVIAKSKISELAAEMNVNSSINAGLVSGGASTL